MEWDIRRETIQHIAGKCLCENIFKKAIYFSLKIFLSGLYIFFAKKVDSDFQTTLKVIQQGFFSNLEPHPLPSPCEIMC